jgi:hypothetical protein
MIFELQNIKATKPVHIPQFYGTPKYDHETDGRFTAFKQDTKKLFDQMR